MDSIDRIGIIYEDNHLLVVQKPPGMPSQPDESGDADVHTVLKDYIKEKYDKPGNVYLGLVHRLDRMVEGVMVLARTGKAANRLSTQLRTGALKRQYLAICAGCPDGDTGVLKNDFIWDGLNRKQIAIPYATLVSKYAELQYKVIKRAENCSLLSVQLQTGRQHQIRAQLGYAGYPLLGDIKYGANKPGDIGLFSAKLTLIHPTKKEIMTFEAKYPQRYPFNMFEEQ